MKNKKANFSHSLDLNQEFTKTFDLIENSNDCIFITGNAGTGKSTLLRYFKENTKKNAIVLAPTGVAAINVKGQTIHSFFKFPPSFISKEKIHKRKRNKQKIFKNLDTLIIDEASMVRADLMDGIDYALRINREKDIPFGGIQAVFFGDLFQLPPVIERDLNDFFSHHYKSPYFFDSKVFSNINLKYIELTKIYRQTDQTFIELLNKVRNKQTLQEDLNILNQRFNPKIPANSNNTITLTTTNIIANNINETHLLRLNAKEYQYEADITGKFEEPSFPTEAILRLKKNTQVMLIRNDSRKRWVNGTIGKVEDLSKTCIKVSINNNIHEIPKETWEKIQYSYNEKTQRIEEETIGTFEQYPIKLAWAITIHKSQGKTFDNVIIDLGYRAFAHGQVYVALYMLP